MYINLCFSLCLHPAAEEREDRPGECIGAGAGGSGQQALEAHGEARGGKEVSILHSKTFRGILFMLEATCRRNFIEIKMA